MSKHLHFLSSTDWVIKENGKIIYCNHLIDDSTIKILGDFPVPELHNLIEIRRMEKEAEALANKICKEELGQEPSISNLAFRKTMVHGMVRWQEIHSKTHSLSDEQVIGFDRWKQKNDWDIAATDGYFKYDYKGTVIHSSELLSLYKQSLFPKEPIPVDVIDGKIVIL